MSARGSPNSFVLKERNVFAGQTAETDSSLKKCGGRGTEEEIARRKISICTDIQIENPHGGFNHGKFAHKRSIHCMSRWQCKVDLSRKQSLCYSCCCLLPAKCAYLCFSTAQLYYINWVWPLRIPVANKSLLRDPQPLTRYFSPGHWHPGRGGPHPNFPCGWGSSSRQ